MKFQGSSKFKCLNKFAMPRMLFKESVDRQNECLSMVSLHEEGRRPENKRKDKAQSVHICWNPKRFLF